MWKQKLTSFIKYLGVYCLIYLLVLFAFYFVFPKNFVLRTTRVFALSTDSSLEFEIYADSDATEKVTYIDWGNVTSRLVSHNVYIRNEGSQSLAVNVYTSNWNVSYNKYLFVFLNSTKRVININEVVPFSINLLVSYCSPRFSFSFDINVFSYIPSTLDAFADYNHVNDGKFNILQYNQQLQANSYPYIVNETHHIESLALSSNQMTVNVSAPTGATSTTEIYVAGYGEPSRIIINNATYNGWTFNALQNLLTIFWVHQSPINIVIQWFTVGPSFLRQTQLYLVLTTAYSYEPSQPANIGGWLTDIYNNPLQDATITILFNWLTQKQHAKTDNKGNFLISFTTPQTQGQYNITINYAGNTQYTQCGQNITITIHKTPNPQTFIGFYIIPTILLLIGAAIFFKRVTKTKK